mmetsp:Transcript_14764/g.39051  ORF Transcript_14764/g.39051 Transcript_14764/m.39051 type:complete len:254 (+) Transcript_14764:120-881(+)
MSQPATGSQRPSAIVLRARHSRAAALATRARWRLASVTDADCAPRFKCPPPRAEGSGTGEEGHTSQHPNNSLGLPRARDRRQGTGQRRLPWKTALSASEACWRARSFRCSSPLADASDRSASAALSPESASRARGDSGSASASPSEACFCFCFRSFCCSSPLASARDRSAGAASWPRSGLGSAAVAASEACLRILSFCCNSPLADPNARSAAASFAACASWRMRWSSSSASSAASLALGASSASARSSTFLGV